MKNALKYYVRVFSLLFPIFFLPFVIDGYGFGKTWFLGATALIGLVWWAVDLLISRRQMVKLSWPFWVGSLLTLWAGVTFLRLPTGAQMRSVMDPVGMGTLLSLWAWLFLWIQVSDKEETKKQFSFLSIAGVIVGVVSLVVFLLPSSKLPLTLPKDNPIISINTGFSLTGSILAEAIFLFFLGFEWLKRLLGKLKGKEDATGYMKEAIATAFFGLMIILDVYKIVKMGWSVIDGVSAWVIAVEALKTSPIFGLGIGNFVEAFNLFRPASYNLTKFWSTAFTGSSMGVLQIWTELGVVGLLIALWFVGGFLKKRKQAGFWEVGLLLAATLFLPLTTMTLFLLTFLVANKLFEIKETKLILNVGERNFNAMPWIVTVLLFAAVGFSGYWWTRILIGELYLRQSLLAASQNNGSQTYAMQIKAIGMNPMNAGYRKMYSQTNLAIAQTLLTNKDISEEDKQKASTLVQQSVREAKAAISLDNLNAEYWTNLAVIYKSLIGLVDGSADWSFQAYQQAVALDPANPLTKLDMGGLLYAAKRYDEADRVFEQVVSTKSDFANGWYNWAYTAKQTNKLGDAVTRLDQAVKLVPVDSGDYETANNELTKWKKELEEATKQQQQQQQQAEQKQPETLKTPETLPTMGQEEKVNVPAKELEPPKTTSANISPMPSIAPTQATGTGAQVTPSPKP